MISVHGICLPGMVRMPPQTAWAYRYPVSISCC